MELSGNRLYPTRFCLIFYSIIICVAIKMKSILSIAGKTINE
jgi:hypothetical protein